MAETQARIVLTASDKTKAAFDSAKASVRSLTEGAVGLQSAFAGIAGAAIVVDQLNKVRAAIDRLDAIDDLSEKYGVAASKLAGYTYASEVAGTSTEAFAAGLNKLSKNLAAAAGGGAEQAAAFKAIGVAVKDSNGQLRDADEVLLDVADKFASYQDGAGKAALAQQIFGKSGAELIPILNKGRAGIQELVGEAQRLGLVMGDDAYKAAGDLNDNLKKLELASQALSTRIAAELVPGLAKWTEGVVKSLEKGTLLEALFNRMRGNAELDPLAFDRKAAQDASRAVENVVTRITQLQEVLKRDADAGVPVANPAVLDALKRAQEEYVKLSAAAAAANDKLKATAQAMKPVVPPGEVDTRGGPPPEKTQAPVVNTKALKDEEQAAKRAQKAYDELLLRVGARVELAQIELQTGEKASEADQLRLEIDKALKNSEIQFTAAQRASLQAISERGQAVLKANERQREGIQLSQAATRLTAQQIQQAEEQTKGIVEQLQEYGKTATQVERLRIARLEDALAAKEQRLQAMQLFGATQDQIAQEQQLIDKLREGIQARKGIASQTEALQTDPVAGARRGVQDYLETIENAGEASRAAVSRGLSTLEDDLTTTFASGKISAKGFVDTVIAEFYRMAVVKPFLRSLFGGGGGGGIFGSLLGALGGSSGGGGGLIDELASYGVFAKGGVFGRGITPFASGGVFDGPQLIQFASGGATRAGVVGEAGPEAAMPLQRGPDGKLGVAVTGRAAAAPVLMPAVTVNIDGTTDKAVLQAMVRHGVREGINAVLTQLRVEGVR